MARHYDPGSESGWHHHRPTGPGGCRPRRSQSTSSWHAAAAPAAPLARETVRIRGIEGRGHGAACDRDLSGRVTSLSQGGPRAGAVWAAGTRPGPADRPGYGASCLTVAHRDWQAAARRTGTVAYAVAAWILGPLEGQGPFESRSGGGRISA